MTSPSPVEVWVVSPMIYTGFLTQPVVQDFFQQSWQSEGAPQCHPPPRNKDGYSNSPLIRPSYFLGGGGGIGGVPLDSHDTINSSS